MEHMFRSVLALLTMAFALYTTTVIAQTHEIGDFSYSEMKDEFDDSDRSMITTKEMEGGSLHWRCMSDGLNIMLCWILI